jgi:hypothetical protein
MKGSAITGPVGKEAAELWPVSSMYSSIFNSVNEYSVSHPTLVSSCKGSFFIGVHWLWVALQLHESKIASKKDTI